MKKAEAPAAWVSPFRADRHDHSRCRKSAMQTLERVCRERDLRLTTLRRQVFAILCHSHQALGAYEVLDRLSEQRAGVRPPTVYRALEFLLENGFVHRLEARNAYVACGDPSAPHNGQFLICETCGSVAELADANLTRRLQDSAQASGFLARKQQIEVLGRCANCA